VPWRPRIAPEAWDVGTEHFAERFQLFVIIALGESIVVTGATTSQLELTPARVIAFAIAFLGTAALWWLYFNFVATLAERALERAERRTLLARDAYTYLHIVIIAGILLSAVGDEIVIAHPTDELSAAELAVVVGGPAVYLLAQAAVRLRVTGRISLRRIGGALACFAIVPIAAFAPALLVAGALLAVLIGVIVADQVVAVRRTGGRTRARTA